MESSNLSANRGHRLLLRRVVSSLALIGSGFTGVIIPFYLLTTNMSAETKNISTWAMIGAGVSCMVALCLVIVHCEMWKPTQITASRSEPPAPLKPQQ